MIWCCALAALQETQALYEAAKRDALDAKAWSIFAARLRMLIPKKFMLFKDSSTSTANAFEVMKGMLASISAQQMQLAMEELMVKLKKVVNSDFLEAASLAKDMIVVERLMLTRNIDDWLNTQVSIFQVRQRVAFVPGISDVRKSALLVGQENESYECMIARMLPYYDTSQEIYSQKDASPFQINALPSSQKNANRLVGAGRFGGKGNRQNRQKIGRKSLDDFCTWTNCGVDSKHTIRECPATKRRWEERDQAELEQNDGGAFKKRRPGLDNSAQQSSWEEVGSEESRPFSRRNRNRNKGNDNQTKGWSGARQGKGYQKGWISQGKGSNTRGRGGGWQGRKSRNMMAVADEVWDQSQNPDEQAPAQSVAALVRREVRQGFKSLAKKAKQPSKAETVQE